MDKRNQRQTPKPARHNIVADYTLLPGIPDEMVDAAGAIRPGWSGLLAGFDELGPDGLSARFERGTLDPRRPAGGRERRSTQEGP